MCRLMKKHLVLRRWSNEISRKQTGFSCLNFLPRNFRWGPKKSPRASCETVLPHVCGHDSLISFRKYEETSTSGSPGLADTRKTKPITFIEKLLSIECTHTTRMVSYWFLVQVLRGECVSRPFIGWKTFLPAFFVPSVKRIRTFVGL